MSEDDDTPGTSKGLQGLPLFEWGPGPRDRCLIAGYPDLERLLRAWWSTPTTRAFRLWSRRDDLMLGARDGELCALQFLRSDGQYGTTAGDPERTTSHVVTDLDGVTRTLRGADFVRRAEALPLMLRFVADGDVPDDDAWEPTFAGPFFELSLAVGTGPSRDGVSSDPWSTSLAPWFGARALSGSVPAWARTFVQVSRDLGLLELSSDVDVDALASAVAASVESLATSAFTPLQIAERLADALAETPGVEEVFGTAAQISDALHRALSESAPPPI